MARILLVDDERLILESLVKLIRGEGHEAVTAPTCDKAMSILDSGEEIELAILDIWMPGMNGLEFLEKIRKRDHMLPVIMLTGRGSIPLAVKATKLGATDFFEKPFNSEKLLFSIRNALEISRLTRENRDLRHLTAGDSVIVGRSKVMLDLNEKILLAAPSNGTVLITGENGTGKELVAREIHKHSERSDGPFIRVNCAAIPDSLIESELFGYEKGAFTGASRSKTGRLESADGGTFFLDEIGDMSLPVQAKLLRVLQEREFERLGGNVTITVDTRVIAATNKNLEDSIKKEMFREDLYFRLNVIPIEMPALRMRGSDISLLATHFLDRFSSEYGKQRMELTEDSSNKLEEYHWPGNVRELRNLMERFVIMSKSSRLETTELGLLLGEDSGDNPDSPDRDGMEEIDLMEELKAYETELLTRALEKSGWNVSRAARALKTDRANLHRRIRRLGIPAAPP